MFSPLNIPDNWRASKCMPNSKYHVNKKKKNSTHFQCYILGQTTLNVHNIPYSSVYSLS